VISGKNITRGCSTDTSRSLTKPSLKVRHQSPLCAGVAFDVALGGFDGTMPREQLHVAQA
jgi:hypothetical protein